LAALAKELAKYDLMGLPKMEGAEQVNQHLIKVKFGNREAVLVMAAAAPVPKAPAEGAKATPPERFGAILTAVKTVTAPKTGKPPASERLPQLTVQGNDLIGENTAGRTEVVMPNHDKLAGWWIVRRGASKLTVQFLRAGEVHFSNRSPDGGCIFDWDGFGQGLGIVKFDVRIDPKEKLVRFYSLGSVKEDGSPSSEELGTAVLLGQSRLKVRARLPNAYNVLD